MVRTNTQAINPVTRTEQLGIMATRGGTIVLDAFFTEDGETTQEFCKMIMVGGAGKVIVENSDGKALFFAGSLAGDYIPVLGRRVLTDHTFPAPLGLQATTATLLFWLGGV
jgi:hypothetical protein